ncbi:hypothetical protein PAPYR_10542 [Paratrimastix pyriformis]|uniref:Uncharacterized protein n=1 Tax=Paratrimastix pyriformis TaxID=342808 RepID=A0ABQ8UAP3_9EUKA|nr:hypothetical protein PAPYR_10542 [Paratrimastix pyriformis]
MRCDITCPSCFVCRSFFLPDPSHPNQLHLIPTSNWSTDVFENILSKKLHPPLITTSSYIASDCPLFTRPEDRPFFFLQDAVEEAIEHHPVLPTRKKGRPPLQFREPKQTRKPSAPSGLRAEGPSAAHMDEEASIYQPLSRKATFSDPVDRARISSASTCDAQASGASATASAVVGEEDSTTPTPGRTSPVPTTTTTLTTSASTRAELPSPVRSAAEISAGPKLGRRARRKARAQAQDEAHDTTAAFMMPSQYDQAIGEDALAATHTVAPSALEVTLGHEDVGPTA